MLISSETINKDGYMYIRQRMKKMREFRNLDFAIMTDKREACGFGNTLSLNGKVDYVYVGIKELYENPNNKLDIDKFIDSLGSMEHEFSHVDILTKGFNTNTPLMKCLSVNYFAGACSKIYDLENYWHCVNELAAQYLGIIRTKNILEKIAPDYDASKLIVDYVNRRIEKRSEFIECDQSTRYNDYEDILKDFEAEFDRVKMMQRSFPYDEYKNLTKDQNNDVSARIYRSGNVRFLQSIASEENGMKQDLRMAKKYFDVEDKNHIIRKRIPAISSVDFKLNVVSPKINPVIATMNKAELIDIVQELKIINDQINFE